MILNALVNGYGHFLIRCFGQKTIFFLKIWFWTKSQNLDLDDARKRVNDSDNQREIWHKKYFGIDYRSPYLYRMVLNSEFSSDEKLVQTIAHFIN